MPVSGPEVMRSHLHIALACYAGFRVGSSGDKPSAATLTQTRHRSHNSITLPAGGKWCVPGTLGHKASVDELSKNRLLVEADLAVEGIRHVDRDLVVAYASDLRLLLSEADIAESKAFLRSFVKKIVVEHDRVKVSYKLPVPVEGGKTRVTEVLPMVTPSGAEVSIGRTIRDFYLSFGLGY